MLTSRLSGDDGTRFKNEVRHAFKFCTGQSAWFIRNHSVWSRQKKRLKEMNCQTEQLSEDEKRMKRMAGQNTAVTNTVILFFDLAMLFLSAKLVGFDGCLIVTLALMSSFGSCSLASLGATLQNTFAAGNRVLDILDESPVVEEITGKEEMVFHGAAAREYYLCLWRRNDSG